MSNSIATYWEMGGYGAFIWPAYALTAIIMVWLLWRTVKELHSAQSEYDRLRDAGEHASQSHYRYNPASK